MIPIQINVLKTPEIIIDKTARTLPYQKAEALLYYLAIEKKVTRDEASALLWEGCDDATAKKNLRHAIYTIKKALGVDLLLTSGRQFLIFNEELSPTVDYDEFLQEGLFDAYQGELLKGFHLKNTLAFDEWLREKRDFIATAYLKHLYQHLKNLSPGELREAELLFEQYTKEEPLDEEVYRLMMELYEKNRLYYKGLRLYQKLSGLMEKELAASPGKETRLLYKRLLHQLSETAGSSDRDKLPPIVGRAVEIRFLTDAFRRFLTGASSALLLTGESGSGKTHLAEYFLKLIESESCLVLQFSCLETEQVILLQAFNALMLKLERLIEERGIEIESRYMEAAACLFPMFGSLDVSQTFLENASISYSYRTTRNLLLKFFYSLGEQLPILFFFDNINFMDLASLDLLLQLIRSKNPNLMFLLTSSEPIPTSLHTALNPLFKENELTQYRLSPYTGENRSEAYPQAEVGEDFVSQTMAKIRSLSPDAMKLLSLLSACQTRGDLQLFEDLLKQSPLILLDLLDELKAINILNERSEGKSIYYSFRNNSIRRAIYEGMAPSRRRYFHEILAEHLTALGGFNAAHYECLIYHYSQAGNEALELKYHILLLEEYTKRYYELYPMQYASGQDKESDVRSFPDYCDKLEKRLLCLSQDELNKINAPRSYISLLRTKAQYCIAQGSYEEGLESAGKALLINRQTGKDALIQIRCLRLINFYRLNIWKIKDLEASLLECLRLGEKEGFKEEFAIDCRLYGLYAAMHGDYKASLRYLKRSMRIFTDFPLKSRIYTINIAACHNYIGETWRKQKIFDKAIDSYEKAISLSQETPCPGVAVFYSNLARALKAIGQEEKSEEAFYRSDAIYNDSAALIGRSITKGYMSLLEAEKGNFLSARKYILQAEESAKQLASPHSFGFLAHARFMLRFTFPDEFEDLMPEPASEYRQEAIRCLKSIPGIYELEELEGYRV